MSTTIKISTLIKTCIAIICFVIISYMAFNFGDTARNLGITKDYGISEMFGGKQQSKTRSDALGGSNVYGPIKTTTNTTIPGLGKTYVNTSTPGKSVSSGSSSGSSKSSSNYSGSSAAASKAKGEAYIPGLSDLKQTQGFQDFLSTNPGATGEDYLNFLNSGMGEEINNLFSESENFLNKQEQALRGSEQDLYNIAQSPYAEALPELQAATEQGKAQYQAGMQDTSLQGRSLLSEAQRLANELAQRNQQAFGGAQLSSTAQAAGELLNRNTAQQLGSIRQNTAQSVQKLQQGLIDFENQSKAKVQQLELQKGKALAEAKLKFQDALSQIDSQRSQLAQNKAAAKLDALREFRAQVADINAQERAFRQNIELMREQARINASNEIASLQSISGQLPQQMQGIQGGLQSSADMGYNNTLSYNSVAQPQNLSGYLGNLFGKRDENLYA